MVHEKWRMWSCVGVAGAAVKYLVALCSIIGLAVYVEMLRFLEGFRALSTQPFTIWSVSALFPFVYLLFMLASCFVRRPGLVMIRTAVVMQAAMALYLLQVIFTGLAIGAAFVLAPFGFWLLMFLEKCGVISLGHRDVFVGVAIVILMQIGLALLILGATYLNMSLAMEGLTFIGVGLAFGMASYLWAMNFADRVRVESISPAPTDSEQAAG